MSDFDFRKQPGENWVVLAPRRAHRTNEKQSTEICPFCIGQEGNEQELYRVGGKVGDSNWQIRVVPNKFPFTPYHEIIIHSPDHHKNIDELPFSQAELLIKTYRQRFQIHERHGQVYIFHNRGHAAGESQQHPHTQVTVVPQNIKLAIQPLDTSIYQKLYGLCGEEEKHDAFLETDYFLLFCPVSSAWPDEVWLAPKRQRTSFGQLSDHEVTDLAFVLSRLIQIFDIRHGYEFPFNFYIYPGKNWYLRLIPRLKILGGFELGTNVIVNTQDPAETFAFIREHFWEPNAAKIKTEHTAKYRKKI